MTKLKELANGNTLFNRNFTDSLRGIAILLVITSHIAGAIGTNLCTPLGGIGVALFLFLSGYGLNESYKAHGLKLFWIKRITKVLLPYFRFTNYCSIFQTGFQYHNIHIRYNRNKNRLLVYCFSFQTIHYILPTYSFFI